MAVVVLHFMDYPCGFASSRNLHSNRVVIYIIKLCNKFLIYNITCREYHGMNWIGLHSGIGRHLSLEGHRGSTGLICMAKI